MTRLWRLPGLSRRLRLASTRRALREDARARCRSTNTPATSAATSSRPSSASRGAAQDLPALPRAQGQAPDLADLVRAEGRRLVRGPLRVEVRQGDRSREAGRDRPKRTRPPRSPKPRARALPPRPRAAPTRPPRRPSRSRRARQARQEQDPEGRRVARCSILPRDPWQPNPAPRSSSTASRSRTSCAPSWRARSPRLVAAGRRPPCLAVVLVGDDPASASYIKGKRRACERVGMGSVEHELAATVSEAAVLERVAALNRDDGIDGILVQLPLPKGMRPNRGRRRDRSREGRRRPAPAQRRPAAARRALPRALHAARHPEAARALRDSARRRARRRDRPQRDRRQADLAAAAAGPRHA